MRQDGSSAGKESASHENKLGLALKKYQGNFMQQSIALHQMPSAQVSRTHCAASTQDVELALHGSE